MIENAQSLSTNELLEILRERLAEVPPDDRLEMIRSFGFCKHCGWPDPDHNCRCWDDT